MISRSDCEPLPTPTLSPFARGYLSLCRFFTAAVCGVCLLCGVRVAVGSFSNKPLSPKTVRSRLRPGSTEAKSARVTRDHEWAELADIDVEHQ